MITLRCGSLVQALESEPEVEVVSEAPDGGAAVQMAKQLQEEAPLKDRRIFPLVTPRPARAIIHQ
jgi:DNA-binding NarL/FixJ family response regulator